MKFNFFKTALVLGLLSAMGPFAIDIYLPANSGNLQGLQDGQLGLLEAARTLG